MAYCNNTKENWMENFNVLKGGSYEKEGIVFSHCNDYSLFYW
jgi:hypothetical protein